MAKKKIKTHPFDGLTPKLLSQYSSAIRKVWSWSHMRRKAVKRATNEDGFIVCELCSKVVPKGHVDHIIPVGSLESEGFFQRLNVPSDGLRVLCPPCHRAKTKADKS